MKYFSLAVALLMLSRTAFPHNREGETLFDPEAASGQPAIEAQSASADLRGIYIIVLDYPFTSSDALKAQAALRLPGVDGLALVSDWNSLEPARGQYDWRSMDKWVGFADSLGKKITLVVKAGSGIPSWLFQPPPR